MAHKNKSEKQARRKLQLIKAAKKYNISRKGRKRSKKYEKTNKAVKRRHKYRHSTTGKETTWIYNYRKRCQREQEKKKEAERKRKERLKERERKEKEEWRLHDTIGTSEDPYYRGSWIAFNRKRFEKIYGTFDYYDGTNEKAREWEEYYLKKECICYKR